MIKLKSVTVISNIGISTDAFVLSFARDFNFRAGQVLGVALSVDDDLRLYSFASGENDENIDILYNIKPGGKLTPNLATLKTGDTLWISVPFGTFEGSLNPAFWIAAGTGISPFRSMLRSGMGENKTLIHGGKTLSDFYFCDELGKAFGANFHRCCSRQLGKGVFHGRVTQFIEQMDKLPTDQKYYLCGSAEMVVECREILLGKDIPFNNIVSEIYS